MDLPAFFTIQLLGDPHWVSPTSPLPPSCMEVLPDILLCGVLPDHQVVTPLDPSEKAMARNGNPPNLCIGKPWILFPEKKCSRFSILFWGLATGFRDFFSLGSDSPNLEGPAYWDHQKDAPLIHRWKTPVPEGDLETKPWQRFWGLTTGGLRFFGPRHPKKRVIHRMTKIWSFPQMMVSKMDGL